MWTAFLGCLEAAIDAAHAAVLAIMRHASKLDRRLKVSHVHQSLKQDTSLCRVGSICYSFTAVLLLQFRSLDYQTVYHYSFDGCVTVYNKVLSQ